MWGGESFMRGPGGHIGSKSAPCSPVKPFHKRAPAQPDSFHVIHKVPLGDSPYVKAKHVQLVDKDPDAAIALFWAAINAGDRVDSALKDMAIVMKQQNRPEEAIEAIKSLRFRCSDAAQESLDNVLLDLYKRCGRLDDQIALLKHKLHLIHQGMAFNGKRTKTARSQGKKFQVSIEQEATRLLGNLGWAYMQQSNFLAAEAVYRKALSIGPDNNKVCNLGICLMKQGRLEEAKSMLQSVVPACPDTRWGSDSHLKSYERAQEMLLELEASMGHSNGNSSLLQSSLWQPQAAATHQSQRSAETKVEPSHADVFAGALSATAGFGPTSTAASRPAPKKMSSAPSQLNHQRPATANNHERFQSYQDSAVAWDDYESDYSLDENVDTNIQGVSQGLTVASSHFPQLQQLQQQQQQWPGEVLRQKSDNYPGTLSESNTVNQQPQQQPLGVRKLDRSLTYGGPQQRVNNSYSNSTSNGIAESYGFSQVQQQRDALSQNAMNGSNHSAKPSTMPKSSAPGDRAPLTQDRTNVHKAAEEENAAFKLVTNGWGKPMKSPLGNSELSFFSRWGYDENRGPTTVRRSLSLESFDTQLEQIALENEEADNEMNLPQGGANVKRPRNVTPVKEKSTLWGSLGFIHTSEGLKFAQNEEQLKGMTKLIVGQASNAPAASTNLENRILADKQQPAPSVATSTGVADAEMIKRQRRLRVFQEITLFPGSPQQVSG